MERAFAQERAGADDAASDAEGDKQELKEEPESNLKGGDIQCINQF